MQAPHSPPPLILDEGDQITVWSYITGQDSFVMPSFFDWAMSDDCLFNSGYAVGMARQAILNINNKVN